MARWPDWAAAYRSFWRIDPSITYLMYDLRPKAVERGRIGGAVIERLTVPNQFEEEVAAIAESASPVPDIHAERLTLPAGEAIEATILSPEATFVARRFAIVASERTYVVEFGAPPQLEPEYRPVFRSIVRSLRVTEPSTH